MKRMIVGLVAVTLFGVAEERTDGRPLQVTAIDVDAAVEKALKGSAEQATPKNSK